jgi:hypothetical protein
MGSPAMVVTAGCAEVPLGKDAMPRRGSRSRVRSFMVVAVEKWKTVVAGKKAAGRTLLLISR